MEFFLKEREKLVGLWLAFRILWHVLLKFPFLQILVSISGETVEGSKNELLFIQSEKKNTERNIFIYKYRRGA